jgi:hypothetical protein
MRLVGLLLHLTSAHQRGTFEEVYQNSATANEAWKHATIVPVFSIFWVTLRTSPATYSCTSGCVASSESQRVSGSVVFSEVDNEDVAKDILL